MNIFLFITILGCTSLVVCGIVGIRKDMEELKNILEKYSKQNEVYDR
jgi:hypothetical protein